jgi:plastocyanin
VTRGRRAAGAIAAALALAAAAACGGRAEAPRTHAVRISGFVFQPAELAVSPGDTVVFTNADLVPHTATAADSSWNSGEIARDATWRLVVPESGIAEYTCLYHPTMKARLTSQE